MRILCVGQSAYDITLPIMGYPEENRKYKIRERFECGGGSSNNMAYLLAKWQMDVYLASAIGKDIYGKKILEELESVGVKTKYMEINNVIPTTTSYIINNLENGSRTIITNKSKQISYQNIDSINEDFDMLLFDGNELVLSKKVIQDNPGAIKIIDAGSLKDSTIELSKLCDYVVCSNDFLRDYTGITFKCNEKDKIMEAYDKMAKDFSGQIIVTLEAFGSMTKMDNEFHFVPSIKVDSVDTTGAGDIYHGALAYFLSQKYSLLEAMHYANIGGALSTLCIGSKPSMPYLESVLNYHGS